MNSLINVLIVDDEPLARENIRILLKNDPEINITAEAGNGAEALHILKEQKIDLLFLDIQMPEVNGFELLSDLTDSELPVIIFVTAYDRYAIRAFKVHALDYLLKPYSDESFYSAISKAKEYIKLKNQYTLNQKLISLLSEYSADNPVKHQRKYLQRIAVSLSSKIILLKTDDIEWIDSADYYVQLHTTKHIHLLRESMNRLEEQLDPDKFVRIHRSTIVNIEKIKEIEAGFGSDYIVVLLNGTKLKLSKSRKKALKEKLNINSPD